MSEVFVSYAHSPASDGVVEELQSKLSESGAKLIRDKDELKFKDSIEEFMQRIGTGSCIVLVLSKKYFESKYCMYELTQIAARGELKERVFPVILDDANIYDAVGRIPYVKHWNAQISTLEQARGELGENIKLRNINDELDMFVDFRNTIDGLLDILGNMVRSRNTAEVVAAILAKLEEDRKAAAVEPIPSSIPPVPFFFGRDKELETIADAIAPDSRTWGVLIDGPGGIGKTTLAMEAGHRAPREHFSRKVFLSAKIRDLAPSGETKLTDFMLPNFVALVTDLGREMGDENLAKVPENDRAKEVRAALIRASVLLLIDNLETFEEPERQRLFQFLNRLPTGCKAIVTSRRRTDVDARIIRLERLERDDALGLLEELAKSSPLLLKASRAERVDLYEATNGNPLLIRWTAGQLGRGRCRTVGDALQFLNESPPANDPLEYIFGDLLDTFSDTETAVLAALTHFKQAAKVPWIVSVSGCAANQVQTALEDLTGRALLVADAEQRTFFLPPLTAQFLRRRRMEAVAETERLLGDRALAVALENGTDYKTYPVLEAEWPMISAAIPGMLRGPNARLQDFCGGIQFFLDFSGRWDEGLALLEAADERADQAKDYVNAAYRAHQVGWIYSLKTQSADVLKWADRVEQHLRNAGSQAPDELLTSADFSRARAPIYDDDSTSARAKFQKLIDGLRQSHPGSRLCASALAYLADLNVHLGALEDAEKNSEEGLAISIDLMDAEGTAVFWLTRSLVAIKREQWESSEESLLQGLTYAREVGRQELLGDYDREFAATLLGQGRIPEASKHAQDAVDTFTRLRSPHLKEGEEVLQKIKAYRATGTTTPA